MQVQLWFLFIVLALNAHTSTYDCILLLSGQETNARRSQSKAEEAPTQLSSAQESNPRGKKGSKFAQIRAQEAARKVARATASGLAQASGQLHTGCWNCIPTGSLLVVLSAWNNAMGQSCLWAAPGWVGCQLSKIVEHLAVSIFAY